MLERHQDPISGHLCLYDDASLRWKPSYAAAQLIIKLQALLAADAEGTEAMAKGEADMPEPLSGHFGTRSDLTILVPQFALEEELSADRGTFTLADASGHLKVLTDLAGADRLDRLDEGVARRAGVPDSPRLIRGEWFDLNYFPGANAWPDVIERARKAVDEGAQTTREKTTRKGRLRRRQARTNWIGITFFEEGPVRGQRRRAWLIFEIAGDGSELVQGSAIGTQALSRVVRRQRTRELAGLESASFMVVGAGSIGGPLAIELVKADAGRVIVVDRDTYDLGNSVRHVLPTSAAGRNKALATAELATELNPYSEVVPCPWAVGAEDHRDELAALLSETDVVVDATAARTVTRLLHRDCVAKGIPLVSAALTPGAFGGRVLTLRSESPCLDCFLAGQDDGSIPLPASGPVPNLTPYGCSHPAASGAGFDSAELGAMATRHAIQAADATEYPGPGSDWLIVSFRDYGAGERYREGPLTVHKECGICS